MIGLSDAKNALSGMRGNIKTGNKGGMVVNKKRFELNLNNLKKSLNKNSQDKNLNTNNARPRQEPQRRPDIRTIRGMMLADLKFEITRNPFINES